MNGVAIAFPPNGLGRILKPAEVEIGAHGEMDRKQFVAGGLWTNCFNRKYSLGLLRCGLFDSSRHSRRSALLLSTSQLAILTSVLQHHRIFLHRSFILELHDLFRWILGHQKQKFLVLF